MYRVETFVTGCFSGTLNPKKLEDVINKKFSQGWGLSHTIKEEKRVFFIFKREALFLIFKKIEEVKYNEVSKVDPTSINLKKTGIEYIHLYPEWDNYNLIISNEVYSVNEVIEGLSDGRFSLDSIATYEGEENWVELKSLFSTAQ